MQKYISAVLLLNLVFNRFADASHKRVLEIEGEENVEIQTIHSKYPKMSPEVATTSLENVLPSDLSINPWYQPVNTIFAEYTFKDRDGREITNTYALKNDLTVGLDFIKTFIKPNTVISMSAEAEPDNDKLEVDTVDPRLLKMAGNETLYKIAELIHEEKFTIQEIADQLGLKKDRVLTHLVTARRLKIINREATDYLKEFKIRNKVVQAVKEEASLKKLLEIAGKEKKVQLNKIFSACYKKGLLETSELAYLKKKTVIGKKGETKKRIINFLNDVYEGAPTDTLKNLGSLFNESKHSYGYRALSGATFSEHLNELMKIDDHKKKYSSFVEACKNKISNFKGVKKPLRDVSTRKAFGTAKQENI